MIQSPLNYTGGKYKLLPQILPLFPEKIRTFVDLFCGGCNVGVNVDCDYVIFNDIEPRLSLLFKTLKENDKFQIFHTIETFIDRYDLSRVSKNSYEYYQCNSRDGLGSYNKARFSRLREDLNRKDLQDKDYPIMFYVLVMYAFNNQIRFNRYGEYNLPVGKRDFNKKSAEKLSRFIDRIKGMNCDFTNIDFMNFDIETLSQQDLVYADPPYLITCASYNEMNGWNEAKERALLLFLERLEKKKIRFALSNVLSSRGRVNMILKEWIARHPQFFVYHLNFHYTNSNYQIKDRSATTDEILLTNYFEEKKNGYPLERIDNYAESRTGVLFSEDDF